MTGLWQGIIDCYNGECRDWGQDSQRLTVLIRWPLSTDRPAPSTHRQRHDESHRQPVSNVMMSFSRLAIGLFLSLYCLGDVMREARSFPLSFVSTQLTTWYVSWYHDRTCHDTVTEFVCLLWISLMIEVWCLLAYLIACEQLHHHWFWWLEEISLEVILQINLVSSYRSNPGAASGQGNVLNNWSGFWQSKHI